MRLLLVDDHLLFRRGLELLLTDLSPEAQVVHCGTRAELESCLEDRGQAAYDLVILDLNVPGFFGLESLQYVRRAAPGISVIVLSGDERPEIAQACLQSGALAFVSKAAPGSVQVEALGRILLKKSFDSEATVSRLNGAPSGSSSVRWTLIPPTLTARQRSVLQLAAQGKTNKMIGRELGISDGTVKTHLANLMAVFSVNTRTQLVFELARRGIRIDGDQS